jgi:hypothetical protein
MSLSDPTGAAGYAFGAKLPSTHMTTIATQQVRALDIVSGGTWSLGSNATVNGAGDLILNHLELQTGGSSSLQHAVAVEGAGVVTWAAGLYPALSTRTLDYPQNMGAAVSADAATYWVWDSAVGTGGYWIQKDAVAGARVLIVPLARLPQVGTLKSVTMWINGSLGAGGAHAGDIGTAPVMTVYKRTASSGATSSLGSDAGSTVQATHDADQTLSVTGLSHALEVGEVFVYFSGETGANSKDNSLGIYGISAEVEVDKATP